MTEIMTASRNYSTLADASVENRVKALNAKNNAVPLNEHVGEPLHVVDVITTDGKRSARSNNPETPCVNTYLISEDGTAYYSQSDGVSNNIKDILDLFPDCNKPAGLIITCVERTLPNGNSLKTLKVELPK